MGRIWRVERWCLCRGIGELIVVLKMFMKKAIVFNNRSFHLAIYKLLSISFNSQI